MTTRNIKEKTEKQRHIPKDASSLYNAITGDQQCLMCDMLFKPQPNPIGREQIYCSYECKERAKHYRRKARQQKLDPDDIHVFYQMRGVPPPVGVTARADHPETRKARREAQVAAANANAQKAVTRKETAELELKRMRAEDRARQAVADASKEVGLLPLSEAKDVLSGKSTYLPEEAMAQIRARINHVVTEQLMIVDRVMSGEIVWNSSQTALFKTLINKVVPDVASAKLTNETSSRAISDLSVEELEELVARSAKEKSIN